MVFDGIVIPNVIADLTAGKSGNHGIAGVIGSIDRNKNTHLSIKRAIEDWITKGILVYGVITDQDYYAEYIKE